MQIRTAREFFNAIVLPDVDEFKSDPDDLRRAFHACISLNSLRDRFYKERLPGAPFSRFCEELYTECPEAKAIADVANNAKHFPPERSPVLEVGVATAKSEWENAIWDVSEWDQPTQDRAISYDPAQGSHTWLVNAVLNATAFWRRKLE